MSRLPRLMLRKQRPSLPVPSNSQKQLSPEHPEKNQPIAEQHRCTLPQGLKADGRHEAPHNSQTRKKFPFADSIKRGALERIAQYAGHSR
jgi:hypothetical protein